MLRVVVDRFEKDYVILRLPKNDLPKDIKEGSVLQISIANDNELAHRILKEILRPDE